MKQSDFNEGRLAHARQLNGFNKSALARAIGITPRRYADFENRGEPPTPEVLARLCEELHVETQYFFQDETLEAENLSFRALSRMPARVRDAAFATSTLAAELAAWIDNKADLEDLDLPQDLGGIDPETAAAIVRDRWGLGLGPLPNLVQLLELHGVRVFGMSQPSQQLDAFSFWVDTKPFVLLNARGTAERRRWDIAHELGHLVMHRGHHVPTDRGREDEADEFASHFLLPADRVHATVTSPVTLASVREEKVAWGVSAFAYIRRLRYLGHATEWEYRNLVIEASKAQLRRHEDDIPAEQSESLTALLAGLRTRFGGLTAVAQDLHIHSCLLQQLFLGLTPIVLSGCQNEPAAPVTPTLRPTLRLITGNGDQF